MKRIYDNPKVWHSATQKSITVFGMSGLGKTYLANMLRQNGDWYHYSIDYRIGTAYMGEYIEDNLKRQAMQVPFLADLLKSDSIYIKSNISFENLSPLSSFLGKPGDPGKGGLEFDEYMRRQFLHHRAEVNALQDMPHFMARARDLYQYPHFICDTGGSICEVVNPHDPNDPVLTALSAHSLMIWIEGPDSHAQDLIKRFDRAPKPMCYNANFIDTQWAAFLAETGQTESQVDPDAFVRFAYARAMAYRAPIYRAMAENWGITISADDLSDIRDEQDAMALIAHALGRA